MFRGVRQAPVQQEIRDLFEAGGGRKVFDRISGDDQPARFAVDVTEAGVRSNDAFKSFSHRYQAVNGVVQAPVYWNTANTAPCGSLMIAKRPVLGISRGGTMTFAWRSPARFVVASALTT